MRDLPGIKALVPGSKVSFIFEEDAKSGKAKQVQVEEAVEEAEQVREVRLLCTRVFYEMKLTPSADWYCKGEITFFVLSLHTSTLGPTTV